MPARIPSVDLAGEYAEIGPELEAAVLRVLRSGAYVLGPETEAFEAELAQRVGTRFALGVGSGTEALVLALRAAGVGPGTEVITTAFTYFATVEAILLAGAAPVFSDVEPDGFLLDAAKLDAAVTPRTRAILAVHLFGRCADMRGIGAVARAHDLAVVEDAAQAIEARRAGKAAGAFGSAGCFSFYPSKNLGAAGDGGAVTTDEAELAERVRLLRSHGSGERDVHRLAGTTSRLDSLQAAVLRVKLAHLARWNRRRAELARAYGERLADLEGVLRPVAGPDEEPCWHQYAIRVRPASRRQAVCRALDLANAEWRHFYPRPAYQQPALAQLRLADGACPEAERACAEVICLPIHPRMRDEDLARVTDAVHRGVGGS